MHKGINKQNKKPTLSLLKLLFPLLIVFTSINASKAIKLEVNNKEAMYQKIEGSKCFDLDFRLDLEKRFYGTIDIPVYIVQNGDDSVLSYGGRFDPAYKIYSNTKSPIEFHCESGQCTNQLITMCFKNNRTIKELIKTLNREKKNLKHQLITNLDVVPKHSTFFYAPKRRPKYNEAALYTSFNLEVKDRVKEKLIKSGLKPLDDLINYVIILSNS